MIPEFHIMIISVCTVLASIVSIWAIFIRFTSKIEKKLEKSENSLQEIKDRLAFLEATSIYTMPLEPILPNSRSQAAKEMWKRRRSKQIQNKEEK